MALGTKMGYISIIILIISVMHELGEVKGFRNYEVGDAITWRVPDNNDTAFYGQWAASKRFHVGDSLHFKYKNDSVVIVDKFGFYHCDTTNGNGSFTDGNTIIKLEHPGLSYFISANPDHCIRGQRLEVDVMSSNPTPGAVAPPESSGHHRAESPAPSQAHNSGLQLAPVTQLGACFGLVTIATLFLV